MKPTIENIINYLRANEDDIADSFECSIDDLGGIFSKLTAAPLLYEACKKARWYLGGPKAHANLVWQQLDAALAAAERRE